MEPRLNVNRNKSLVHKDCVHAAGAAHHTGPGATVLTRMPCLGNRSMPRPLVKATMAPLVHA